MPGLGVAAAKRVADMVLIAIGVLLYRVGLGPLLISLHRRAPKVLMYHAFDPEETDFTRGLAINTPSRLFARHLDFLTRHYRVVAIGKLVDGFQADGCVAITIDDGFRSVREHAWPLLRARRLPATCYLTTDVVGNGSLIWLNEINWFLNRHPAVSLPLLGRRLGLSSEPSPGAIVGALVGRYDRALVAEVLGELRAAVGVNPDSLARDAELYLDWQEVREMAAGGMTYGNHTASHPPLARIAPDESESELRRAASALVDFPEAGSTLAYPFGSRSDEVRALAIRLGYRALLEVEGVNDPCDPTRLGRIKVRDDSAAVLFARMEVVEPVKATLKRWLRRARGG